jgi:hypothetical protein
MDSCVHCTPTHTLPNKARIDNVDTVRREVAAWQPRRDQLNARINWQFTTDDARIKLSRLYPTFEA